eukprot:1153694-Pelagomonas_calceolata.AAC.4
MVGTCDPELEDLQGQQLNIIYTQSEQVQWNPCKSSLKYPKATYHPTLCQPATMDAVRLTTCLHRRHKLTTAKCEQHGKRLRAHDKAGTHVSQIPVPHTFVLCAAYFSIFAWHQ